MSAHDPDRLAPSFNTGVDQRIDDMQQRLAEFQRERIAYARRYRVPVRRSELEADQVVAELDAYAERNGLARRDVIAMWRRRGEAVNAAGVSALNRMNVEAAVTARAAAARALASPSAENRAAAIEAVAQLLDTQPQRAGALAETGRALRQAREQRGPEANVLRALRALEAQAGGRDRVDQVIDFLARFDPNDTIAINRFARQAFQATSRAKLYELWINDLLSGPLTHAVNTLSNALNLGIRVGERVPTAALDLARATFTGGGPRERFLGEAAHDLVGMAGGFRDGVGAALRAFSSEIPSEGAAKFLDPGVQMQAIKGRTGRLVRLPSRFLLAADEFFKALTVRGELHARAYRTAVSEGLTGRARVARMAEIIDKPELVEGLSEDLGTAARYWTFQQELTERGNAIADLRNKIPGLSILMPFVRTPINIAKFGLERTPMNLGRVLYKAARGELAGAELTEELTRGLIGTAIAGAVALAAAEGRITGGGPRDPKERDAWRANHEPYSVKIGDRWVSYARLEPLGSIIGLTADAVQIFDLLDQEDFARKAATAIATSLGVNLSNKVYLKGLSDFMLAQADPDRYGERWIASLAGTLVPTGVAQLARAIDPLIRRPRSLKETFQSRVPGLTGAVGPIRNVWGEPVSREGFLDGTNRVAEVAEKLVNPIAVRTIADDPASREVARLKVAPSVSQTLGFRGLKLKLTDAEYDAYKAERGALAKRLVTQIVTGPSYRAAGDDAKRELIRRAFRLAGDQTRDKYKASAFQRMRSGQR